MQFKRKIPTFVVLAVVLALVGGSVAQFVSAGFSEPTWASTLRSNITISGLTKDGEMQYITYLRPGGWSLATQDVCFYIVWRLWYNGTAWIHDQQAYIELANMGNNQYIMEIYHSWNILQVSMPYSYTVSRNSTNILILSIDTSS